MLIIKEVLVATDFSECSNNAIAYARSIAHNFGARMHVMHVANPSATDFLTPGAPMPVIDTRPAERDQLAASVTDDDRHTLRAQVVFVEHGGPAEIIAEYAERHRIDLVVVGTHGRRGVARAILGSVAEKVVRIAPCPVLIVRAHEREFIAPDALTVRN